MCNTNSLDTANNESSRNQESGVEAKKGIYKRRNGQVPWLTDSRHISYLPFLSLTSMGGHLLAVCVLVVTGLSNKHC